MPTRNGRLAAADTGVGGSWNLDLVTAGEGYGTGRCEAMSGIKVKKSVDGGGGGIWAFLPEAISWGFYGSWGRNFNTVSFNL